MNRRIFGAVIGALALAGGGTEAFAGVTPFEETFGAGSANWVNGQSAPLDWVTNGSGIDGPYVSTTANFANQLEGDRVTIFRGDAALGASGGAFVGDWLTAGLDEFSFFIRHDFQSPLFFFARFASPTNFPGTVGISVTPVMPNTWTEITIEIDPNSPFIIPEGPPGTFEATFGNIGNLQIGLEVPAALAGFPGDVRFDLDSVASIPAPGTLAVLALGLVRRRRREGLRAGTRNCRRGVRTRLGIPGVAGPSPHPCGWF